MNIFQSSQIVGKGNDARVKIYMAYFIPSHFIIGIYIDMCNFMFINLLKRMII